MEANFIRIESLSKGIACSGSARGRFFRRMTDIHPWEAVVMSEVQLTGRGIEIDNLLGKAGQNPELCMFQYLVVGVQS